jgi:catechol 2,3-dioxygenase
VPTPLTPELDELDADCNLAGVSVQATPEELDHLFDAVVGAVVLRAGDLDLQTRFYAEALGLHPLAGEGDTVDLTDAQGRALVRLDASRSGGKSPASPRHAGLFHTAFRFPDRAQLGAAVSRVLQAGAGLSGASDHLVSEAIYLSDPEGNGIELYRDRPFDEWPTDGGEVRMDTLPLDVRALISEAEPIPEVAAADVGHIHLRTADVDSTAAFYRDLVGLDVRQLWGGQAGFLAEGLYHHHVGMNSWHSAGAPPVPEDRPGLEGFELRLRSAERVDGAAGRLEGAGVEVERSNGRVAFRDPDRTRVVLAARG